MDRRFAQVDVFGAAPLLGNPVAVVLDGEGLSDADMASIARWTNLSETTFVLPPTDPGADYRVRILTPASELDFAGHPTLGTCHAWLAAGGTPAAGDVVVQQSAAGLVRVRRGERLAFAAPPSTRTAPGPAVADAVAGALGIDPAVIVGSAVLDNGTDWFALELVDADRVLAIEPDHAALQSLPKVGVVGLTDAGLVARAFAASAGVPEDPVTGSLQASVAQWLMDEGRVPASYVASQGTCIGRDGEVHVDRDGSDVWIGGATVTVIEGSLSR
ncbi:MAG: PhzF family phenazine biosynthesis protein [Acidimicrobiia bacterium]|nr:PhzF family phenazine biosynthesis protein [Acidimicrobiia bacterium]